MSVGTELMQGSYRLFFIHFSQIMDIIVLCQNRKDALGCPFLAINLWQIIWAKIKLEYLGQRLNYILIC